MNMMNTRILNKKKYDQKYQIRFNNGIPAETKQPMPFLDDCQTLGVNKFGKEGTVSKNEQRTKILSCGENPQNFYVLKYAHICKLFISS